MPKKYDSFGFHFKPEEVVSSRLAAELAMQSITADAGGSLLWGVITGGRSSAEDVPVDAVILDDHREDYDRVDAIAMMSSLNWSDTRQQLLRETLIQRARPVVIGNPDVVAPHEKAFSLEPGYFAHQLIDELGISIEFHGKPFPSVFDLVRQRVDRVLDVKVPDSRIAMMGDTLHTDVLGAKAAGWGSVLVTDHGLFRDRDVDHFINASGIVPDWIIPSI